MKNNILVFVILLSTTIGCAQSKKKVSGNGNVTTINRTTSDYDVISCAGSFDYFLVAGTEGQITIKGEENLLQHVITEVKDNTLIIKVENGYNLKTSIGKGIKVTIPFKDINRVDLAGSGDLSSDDPITANNLDIALTGSGDVDLSLKATSVDTHLVGSGDITLKGSTTNLKVSITGSGDFSGFELNSDNTVVSISGSGDVQVVSNSSIKAHVSGSGDVDYRGNPTKEDTKVSGSGTISKD